MEYLTERSDILLSKSLQDQSAKAITLAQTAINSYAFLQNQYDSNVILSSTTDKRQSQNIAITTSFGNDDDNIVYIPEFTFLAGSRLRYNRTLPNDHDDPLELVNFQTLINKISEITNFDVGASQAWVSANFVGINGLAYDSSRLGGVSAVNYATKDFLTTNYLGINATAANADKLGNVDAANYALSSVLVDYALKTDTAPDSLRLGGTLASRFATKNYVNRLRLYEDFMVPRSNIGDFFTYNFASGSNYGGAVKLAISTDIDHPGVIQFYSKIVTGSSDSVPPEGIVDPTTYSVGYFYGGPVHLNNTTKDNFYDVICTFKLDDITNNKFVIGLLNDWNPTTGNASEGIFANVINGVLTGKTATGSTNSSTSTTYTCDTDKYYTLITSFAYVLAANGTTEATYLLYDYDITASKVGTGTITSDGITTLGEVSIVGTLTLFTTELIVNSIININGIDYEVTSITDNTHIKISSDIDIVAFTGINYLIQGTVINGSGTISSDGISTDGQIAILGSSSLFKSEIVIDGATIRIGSVNYEVASVVDDTHITIYSDSNITSFVGSNYSITKTAVVWVDKLSTNLPIDKTLYLILGNATTSTTDNFDLTKVDHYGLLVYNPPAR